VAGISGVASIQSFSRENYGLVFVEFKLSMSQDRAIQEVRDKVALLQNLPRDAEKPRVSRLDIAAQPVLTASSTPTSIGIPAIARRSSRAGPLNRGRGAVGRRRSPVRASMRISARQRTASAQIAERIGMEAPRLARLRAGPTGSMCARWGNSRQLRREPPDGEPRPASGTQVSLGDGRGDRWWPIANPGPAHRKEAVVASVKQPGSNTVRG
jgi:hypothetical protein